MPLSPVPPTAPSGDGAARALPTLAPAPPPARAGARPLAPAADLPGGTWWCAFDIETRPLPTVPDAARPRRAADTARFTAQGLDPDAAADKAASLHALLGQVCAWALAVGPAGADTPAWTRTGVAGLSGPAGHSDPAPLSGPADEAALLAALWADVDALETWAARSHRRVVYVSFCGKRFDVPFLVGRSLAHGLPVPSEAGLFDTYPYGHARHLDVHAALAQGDPLRLSLHEACALAGIPSPKADMDGAGVATACAEGRLDDVRRYVTADALATFALAARLHALGLAPTSRR